MRSSHPPPKTIDDYISRFPRELRARLEQLRAAIRKAAPDAEEAISYQMPTFKLNGNLVHFAAFTNHIGFYPAPRAIEAFKTELSRYEGSKGTVRFPLDRPLPLGLIGRIVKFRIKQNQERSAAKTRSRSRARGEPHR